MFRLHDAQSHGAVRIFLVVHVAKADFVFARDEELARRRKYGWRDLAGIQDFQPVAGAQSYEIGLGLAAEFIRLPGARWIEVGVVPDRESIKTGLVNECHGRLFRRGDGLLAEQVQRSAAKPGDSRHFSGLER